MLNFTDITESKTTRCQKCGIWTERHICMSCRRYKRHTSMHGAAMIHNVLAQDGPYTEEWFESWDNESR